MANKLPASHFTGNFVEGIDGRTDTIDCNVMREEGTAVLVSIT